MMAEHREHERLFLMHRKALLDRDLPRARRAFTEFATTLREHAELEERHVFPAYAAAGGEATDSPPAQILKEHDKLRNFLANLERRLAELDEPVDDAKLLDLLDAEAWLKNLMAHHDLREGRAVYPFLSEHVDEPTQLRVLEAVRGARNPTDP